MDTKIVADSQLNMIAENYLIEQIKKINIDDTTLDQLDEIHLKPIPDIQKWLLDNEVNNS